MTGDAAPLAAVSPHLDDLALSCAGVLAVHPGSSMVTVFAGGPASVDPVTDWEAISGMFEPGADVVGARRAEDTRAAELLGCRPVHLDHWDEQYRHARYGYQGPSAEELIEGIGAELEGLVGHLAVATWLVPLGIRHPDHELTAAACRAVADRHPEIDWLVYEELPYAAYEPAWVEELASRLAGRGYRLEAVGEWEPTGDPSRHASETDKREVVECYRSQVVSLGRGVRDALGTPERIHRLSRLN